MVMRAYTPTSSDDDLGHFDLVVKVYFQNQHKDFPEVCGLHAWLSNTHCLRENISAASTPGAQGGRMSQYMERMKLGDRIDVKGPLGHFVYEGRGAFRNSGVRGVAKTMSMIAGGTGITPMFQIIKVGFGSGV